VTRPGAAPCPVARQNALAARAGPLDSTGAHYALFHLAYGPGADMDTGGAADRYAAELRAAGAPRASPAAAALPVANEERRPETSPPPRGEATPTVAHGADRAGARP
jgi:hypothetical protein